ncbi:hypothetical protein FHS37_005083 [Streptomyces griseostramineus]|uniref:Uncharacterized protein n=1 Tax=Streptomyces griseomycini TaxID=66895 RepID=A0A7W7V898_9ACTN|nr:hypothetical protein [Streptomyces griseomycini]
MSHATGEHAAPGTGAALGAGSGRRPHDGGEAPAD